MYTKCSGGGKATLSMVFLVFSACISFAAGVIFAYMSDHGCSKAFVAMAIFSFFYCVINILLIVLPKAWDRIPTMIIFILILGVAIMSLIALGYSVRQSICEICPCAETNNKYNDDFWNDFNDDDNINSRKRYDDAKYCDNRSDSQVAIDFASMIAGLERFGSNHFYIRRGWPISFSVLQAICSLIHLFLAFSSLYSCNGCKPVPSTKGIGY